MRAALALVVCFLSGISTVHAGDLYRLRMLPIADLHPGCSTTIEVVVDHTRYPTQTPLDPNRSLFGLAFGLTLPSPLEFESASFAGTHLKQTLGHDPWYSGVREVPGGITVAIVGDPYLQNLLPEGKSQIVIKLTVSVPASAQIQQHTLSFTDFGEPKRNLWLSMPIGDVIPKTQSATLDVVTGTCSVAPKPRRFWPAAVGQLAQPSPPATTPPELAEEVEGALEIEEAEIEEFPDTEDLPFPEPTDEELEVVWLDDVIAELLVAEAAEAALLSDTGDDVADAISGLVASAEEIVAPGSESGMAMASSGSEPCDFETDCGALPAASAGTFDDPLDPDTDPELLEVDDDGVQNPDAFYSSIQDAIDEAYLVLADPDPNDVTIVVYDGDYDPITINLCEFPDDGDSLTIRSVNGPDVTTISGPDMIAGSAIDIVYDGSGGCVSDLLPGTCVRIGWTTVDRSEPCLLDSADQCKADWYGFTITDGDPSGITVADVGEVQVEIRGNIVVDNGDEFIVGAQDGGGVFIQDSLFTPSPTQGVSIILNEITGNQALQSGGGIFVSATDAKIFNNFIHNNNAMGRNGGGICVQTGTLDSEDVDGLMSIEVCSNEVYDNTAVRGAGVAINDPPVAGLTFVTPTSIEVTQNVIRDNSALASADPNPAGGGLYLELLNAADAGDGGPLRILNNQVHDNSTSVPIGDGCGGGVYAIVDVDFETGTGEDVLRFAEITFEGNTMYDNTAEFEGGGAWLGFFSNAIGSAKCTNNTFTSNLLTETVAGNGEGLFLPFDSSLGYSTLTGENNIVIDNDTAVSDWFAQVDVSAAAPVAWSSCIFQIRPVDPLVEYDLFAASTLTDSPDLTIETKVPGTDSNAYSSGAVVSLAIPEDFERDQKPIDAFEIGADEFFELKEFRRGDVDGNGLASPLIDALTLLQYLHLGGLTPPCMDAADADDDGVVGLVDAQYLLMWGFSIPHTPPPPAPGPTACGPDPLGDPLYDGLDCSTTPVCP